MIGRLLLNDLRSGGFGFLCALRVHCGEDFVSLSKFQNVQH